MNITNNFKNSIKEWVSIDNQIINVDEQILPLKQKTGIAKFKK